MTELFKAGDKVSMLTNIRRLRGFVEHSAYDHVRVRWEDDTIGMLVFDWQFAIRQHSQLERELHGLGVYHSIRFAATRAQPMSNSRGGGSRG